MLGKGVTTYIVSPTTSGAASWPATMPVENVHATPSCRTVGGVDLVQPAEARGRVVLRRHHPLAVVLLKHRGVRRRQAARQGPRRGGGRAVERLLPTRASDDQGDHQRYEQSRSREHACGHDVRVMQEPFRVRGSTREDYRHRESGIRVAHPGPDTAGRQCGRSSVRLKPDAT